MIDEYENYDIDELLAGFDTYEHAEDLDELAAYCDELDQIDQDLKAAGKAPKERRTKNK